VAEIVARSRAITRFLLEHHCKLVVVACNTASAAALAALRAEFAVPFVGMEPAIKPAALATKTGRVGVLATAGTVQGGLFQNTWRRYANGVEVMVQVGEGLVEQVESAQLDTPRTEQLLRQYLDPMIAAGADQIVLGCTHYPLLMPAIERIVAGRASIIDPAQAVARQVQRLLPDSPPVAFSGQQAASPHHRFYTTGPARTFCLPHTPAPEFPPEILLEPITLVYNPG
jgi:glutamate racemase